MWNLVHWYIGTLGYIQDAENVTLASKKVKWICAIYLYGLDYLGTFYVEGNPSKKAWICFFACVAVSAVHLEVADDMTAEKPLMALRKFIFRRGTPKDIILDNAP